MNPAATRAPWLEMQLWGAPVWEAVGYCEKGPKAEENNASI